MKSVVVDASVAVKWFFTEEDGEPYTSEAHLFLAGIAFGKLRAIVPILFFSECANVLWKVCALRGYPQEAAVEALRDLLSLDVEVLNDMEFVERALSIALQCNRPVYDCLYLAMANLKAVDLITADEKFYNSLKNSFSNIKWIGDYK